MADRTRVLPRCRATTTLGGQVVVQCEKSDGHPFAHRYGLKRWTDDGRKRVPVAASKHHGQEPSDD